VKKTGVARSKSNAHAPAFFLRHAGSDLPAAAVAQAAAERTDLPVIFLPGTAAEIDYCLVDETLSVAAGQTIICPPPQPGLGYAGFSQQQRAALHAWIETPSQPAPLAFQQVLLANAEVRLLEGRESADQAQTQLLQLATAPPWHGHTGLARALLLSFWLRQDGQGLAQWLSTIQLPPDLWRTALGMQALLTQPLDAAQLLPVASAWQLPLPDVHAAVLRLRLDSLQTALGQEPLAYILRALGDAAHAHRPWRCQHRDLRLALPQPDVRPLLEPLLRDLLDAEPDAEPGPEPSASPASETRKDAQPNELPSGALVLDSGASPTGPRVRKRKQASKPSEDKVHLILEFEASRSNMFSYVLRQAQKQPGFLQIMDENRHIVYRVPFRRNAMRQFWQIWSYVQAWSSTRVYCEGRQLDSWQIYPYSQYLR
jgi:hypothetical protein